MDIAKLQEIARFLGKETDVAMLEKMAWLDENGLLYITFWGHYSAGKSRLINSILDRDLLPVQSRETTAVLTYIKYGTEEKCIIVHEGDGGEEQPLDYLKHVFQNTDSGIDIESIDHIEVFIQNDLLKTGLVIVDSPGMNTIIQRHQELAVKAINQSGKLFFVLGGSPTEVDRKFIQMIAGCGIEQYFIRTKCDYLNTAEENPENSLQAEKAGLCSMVGHDVYFVPVSNERNTSWFENINIVRSELASLSGNLQEEMEKALEMRSQVFVQEYLTSLRQQLAQLTDLKQGKASELNANIAACKQRVSMLESMVTSREQRIRENISAAQRESLQTLDECRAHEQSEFSRKLAALAPGATAVQDAKDIYDRSLHKAVQHFQDILCSSLNGLVALEQQEENDAFAQVEFQGEPPTYMEIEQENSELVDRYRQDIKSQIEEIERLKQEQQALAVQASEMQAEYAKVDYDAMLKELNGQYAQIPSGAALRMRTETEVQPSEVFKSIGQAADVAFLLLPGKAIASGAKAVAKIPKIASSFGNVAKILKKAGQTIKKIDLVHDAAYISNQVLKLRPPIAGELPLGTPGNNTPVVVGQTKKQKNGSLLDALSIAYWAEKFGKQFDKPPAMEVDVVEEELRNQKRKEIFAQQQRISQERIEKHKALGLIRTHQQELDAKVEENNQMRRRTEQEFERQKAECASQARRQALRRYVAQYEDYFGDVLQSAVRQMHEAYYRKAEQNIVLYIASRNATVARQLQEEQSRLEKLQGMDADADLENAIRQTKAYLDELEAK